MKRGVLAIFLVAAACSAFGAEPNPNEEWQLVKQSRSITLYSRPHEGTHLKEFKANGEIDAAPATVFKVIDDVESYTSFMPYMAECRVIERKSNSIVTYQRLSPLFVADRDYTVLIEKKSWPVEDRLAYLREWKTANERGPAEKPGVFRVRLCTGSWLLEPIGPNQTRATYTIFADGGLALPSFFVNKISEVAIKKLFAAVRKQVKDPRYRAK